MPFADECCPAVAFDRHQIARSAARWDLRDRYQNLPVSRVLRYRKGRGGIGEFDADIGLFRSRTPGRFKERQRKGRAARRANNQIARKLLIRPVIGLKPNPRCGALCSGSLYAAWP